MNGCIGTVSIAFHLVYTYRIFKYLLINNFFVLQLFGVVVSRSDNPQNGHYWISWLWLYCLYLYRLTYFLIRSVKFQAFGWIFHVVFVCGLNW